MQGIRLVIDFGNQVRYRALLWIQRQSFGKDLEDFGVWFDPEDRKAVVSIKITFLTKTGTDMNDAM
ncbi:MAG TPA: hypothetical protein VGN61_04930 [Verrucomicrobiae bacterium]|jgi:hypothetical protein